MSAVPSIPASAPWPALPLASWQDSCATLHMWTQIVGKTRLGLAPLENHWWNAALYVSARGLTTSVLHCGRQDLEIEFDFVSHKLFLRSSRGAVRELALAPRTVADFFAEYMAALRQLGIDVSMVARPVEVEVAVPFAQDNAHAAYDAEAVHRWWRIAADTDRVLKRFRSRFLGKQSPVHFFWGAFDLAYTRFSGRAAPAHPGGVPNCPDEVMVEAYSRECSSCGYWPGGGPLQEAAFYAYAYPEPAGYAQAAMPIAGARYDETLREYLLPYEAVRAADDPERLLLDFLQATYEAAAGGGHWDRATLDRPAQTWP
jgi:hypothetical protein